MPIQPAIFETHAIRRLYDEATETWWFSVVDIMQVLTQQPDYQAARNYWKVLKNRLGKEGSESVTKCNRLKLPAADGKNYLSDVATAETLLRLIQSVPSPKPAPNTSTRPWQRRAGAWWQAAVSGANIRSRWAASRATLRFAQPTSLPVVGVCVNPISTVQCLQAVRLESRARRMIEGHCSKARFI
ncbi:MAG: hypothetical protein Q8O79_07410 [Pseudomonadota bacterium]|nr:hypothetical protein [Pseudomonadota bacterium]